MKQLIEYLYFPTVFLKKFLQTILLRRLTGGQYAKVLPRATRVVIVHVLEAGQPRLGQQADDVAEDRKQDRKFKADNKKRNQRDDRLAADN